ncbi:acyl-CoA thioesterase, partial [Streptomyces sp. SID11233]|nr:acyl-CoA thioesterase [Streptomyces sp. SID11233]
EVKDPETADSPEVVYARAATVVVPYDLKAGRPRRITAYEREYLEKYRDDAGPGGLVA